MEYGYIRVSTREQNEDRQRLALLKYGIPDKMIFLDKQSGKDFLRPQYKRLIRKLKKDDTLVIKSIDRLGRNYEEILEQWRVITKEKQAYIVVLDMPLLDTGKNRDLTGTLIADIVLQLLSYVAQTEREMVHQRQKEGIAAAKARGARFGREPMKRPENYEEVRMRWQKFCSSPPIAVRPAWRTVLRNHSWQTRNEIINRRRKIHDETNDETSIVDASCGVHGALHASRRRMGSRNRTRREHSGSVL